jgi:hypothetical protein
MDESIEKLVKRALAAFFEGGKIDSSLGRFETMRQATLQVLSKLRSPKWRTFIVGGAIRDLVLAPAGSWPRDIDVIVDGSLASDLERLFDGVEKVVVRPSRLGGLHVRKTVNVEGFPLDLLFDVWRLEDSWATKAQKLGPTIEAFLSTSFLNIDSVAVALPTDERTARVFERGFFQAIRDRTLEINSEHNQYPLVCVVRALILAAKLDFWIGPKLAHFIQSVANSATMFELLQAQRDHYGEIRGSRRQLDEWLRNIRDQLGNGNGRVRLADDQQWRLQLWQNWPPHSATTSL